MIMLSFVMPRGRSQGGRRFRRATALMACVVLTSSVLAANTTVSQANPTTNNAGTNAVDNARDGWDSNEPNLTPAQVVSPSFGPVFSTPTKVKGQVYAQPIIANSKLIVATEENVVYGLDPNTGSISWTRDLTQDDKLNTGIPAQYPWPAGSQTVSCSDLLPDIGITSTPVYNPASNSVYFVNKWDNGATHGNAHYFMHAVDPSSGAERPGFPHEIAGVADNDPTITFDAFQQLQRPALLLLDGVVYAGFGSHCDYGGSFRPYRGFIVGVNATTGSQTSMWTTETSVSGAGGAGIWQAGAGLMSDGPGRIFLSTGNGLFAPIPGGATSVSGAAAASISTFSQSVIRLQVLANGKLQAGDFFSPANAEYLDASDLDISSGGPVALPDSFGTSSTPHLLSVQGKDGRIFLLDRDNLGGRTCDPAYWWADFPKKIPRLPACPATQTDRAVSVVDTTAAQYGRHAAWGDGGMIYSVTDKLGIAAYSVQPDISGRPSLTAAGNSTLSYMPILSGSPVITSDSSNKAAGATVWTITEQGADGSNGTLWAVDATPSNGVLRTLRSWPIGWATKFSTPLSYNGRIYVATRCSETSTYTSSSPCTDGQIYAFGSPTSNALTASQLELGSTPAGLVIGGSLDVAANGASVTIRAVSTSAPFSIGTSSAWSPTLGNLPITLGAGSHEAIPVTFASATPGEFNGIVSIDTDLGTFNYTVHALATKAQIRLTAPKLSSGAVSFPVQATGTSRTINVQLSNMSDVPETISNVTISGRAFSLPNAFHGSLALGAAGFADSSVVIPVMFSPSSAPQDGSTQTEVGALNFSGTVPIIAGSATNQVPLSGLAVVANPHITFSPLTTTFGTVAIGKVATKTFALTNDGNVPVSIVKAKAPVSDFNSTKPVDEGTTIPAGESFVVSVQFAPRSVGQKADQYVITPNSGAGPTNVSFTGIGVDVPTAPRSVTITPFTRAATVTWSKAPSNGGLNLTGYVVNATPGAHTCTAGPTVSHCNIVGLTDGATYKFTVRARNALGTSRDFVWSSPVVSGAPSAPRNLAVVSNGYRSSRLTWAAPASSGSAPVARYLYRISADGGTTWSAWTGRSLGPGLSAQLSGLTKAQSYIVQVHAVNRSGVGINAAIRFAQRT